MPKRPRQAHIPQQTKKRKLRRTPLTTAADSYLAPEDNGATFVQPPPPAHGPAEPALSRRAEARTTVLRSAGQLPTFERSYLVNELRQIGLTAAGLLAFIVVLTVILR